MTGADAGQRRRVLLGTALTLGILRLSAPNLNGKTQAEQASGKSPRRLGKTQPK